MSDDEIQFNNAHQSHSEMINFVNIRQWHRKRRACCRREKIPSNGSRPHTETPKA